MIRVQSSQNTYLKVFQEKEKKKKSIYWTQKNDVTTPGSKNHTNQLTSAKLKAESGWGLIDLTQPTSQTLGVCPGSGGSALWYFSNPMFKPITLNLKQENVSIKPKRNGRKKRGKKVDNLETEFLICK